MKRIVSILCFLAPNLVCAATSQSFLIDKAKILELVLFLGLIIVIIIVGAMIVKKLKLTNRFSSNLLSITSTMALTTKDRLIVVKAQNSNILLGLSPGRIAYLCHLEEGDAVTAPTEEKSNFFDTLKQSVKKGYHED